MVYTVGDMLPGVCGAGVNGVWCVLNGLFDRDVPQTVLFVFVPRHDDGTIVYDVAFLLSKCDLTSGVAQLCD